MNFYPLIALVAFIYAGLVFYIVIVKNPAWTKIGKFDAAQKILGERGAEIFYYIWGLLAAGIGIWALMQ